MFCASATETRCPSQVPAHQVFRRPVLESDAADFYVNEESGDLTGSVTARRGNRLVEADKAHYDNIKETLDLEGNIYFEEPGLAPKNYNFMESTTFQYKEKTENCFFLQHNLRGDRKVSHLGWKIQLILVCVTR